ncbi:MAG: hypothetical protein V1668_04720 [Patescibacteria group bacterium]
MNKRLIFIVTFILLGFVFLQIPFTNIIGGSTQKFSLFDFFAPTIGAFLASGWGAVTVIVVKTFNVAVHHQAFDLTAVIRLFPLAFAALYFGARKYKTLVGLIPLACMALFIMHPAGSQAWYYSLYWLIPVAASFTKKSLVMNSLGATFTAHAIGSVAFLYAFNLPAETWIALIPVVFLERMLFTAGIAASYVAMNSLVKALATRLHLPFLNRLIKPEFVASKKLLSYL